MQFNVLATPVGPFAFVGDVAGDLEGTVLFQFDASSVTFAGITISNEGTAEWAITGGIIPDPLGFTTHFDNRNLNVDRPGSPGTQFENVGSHRAAAGVDVANLTYRGIFAFDPAPLADHAYRGTICP